GPGHARRPALLRAPARPGAPAHGLGDPPRNPRAAARPPGGPTGGMSRGQGGGGGGEGEGGEGGEGGGGGGGEGRRRHCRPNQKCPRAVDRIDGISPLRTPAWRSAGPRRVSRTRRSRAPDANDGN